MAATPVLRTVAALRAAVAGWRAAGETVGLVPTMGALHAGHLALVAAARAANRRAVVTIFVNPSQFGPAEDFAAYPRDEAEDVARAAAAGADAVFAPPMSEVYPPDFTTGVQVGGLTAGLCGPFRPGHFEGMATIVTKLLLMALPDAAYFGEKDYQQLQVVRRLARDLDIPVRIDGVATVREPDGLALSSRNIYLSPAERAQAAALHRELRRLADRITDGRAIEPEIAAGTARLRQAGFAPIDYVAVCDAATLVPLAVLDRPGRVLAAAHLGRTRLIDNVGVVPAATR